MQEHLRTPGNHQGAQLRRVPCLAARTCHHWDNKARVHLRRPQLEGQECGCRERWEPTGPAGSTHLLWSFKHESAIPECVTNKG